MITGENTCPTDRGRMPLCASERGFIVSDAQRETGGTGVGDPKEAAKILGVRIHMNFPKNGEF